MLGGKVATEYVDVRMCALGPNLREVLNSYEEWQDGSALIVECALHALGEAFSISDAEAEAFATEVGVAVLRLEALKRKGHNTDDHPLWGALALVRTWGLA